MKRGLASAAIFVLLVPVLAAATEEGPQPKIPFCAISAPPGTYYPNSAVTLIWYSENAISATIAGVGQVPLQGSHTVHPDRTRTYTLTVANNVGSRNCSVAIVLRNQAQQPQTPVQSTGGPLLYYPQQQAQYPVQLSQPVMVPYLSQATNYRPYANYNTYTPSPGRPFLYTETIYSPSTNLVSNKYYRCVTGFSNEAGCVASNSTGAPLEGARVGIQTTSPGQFTTQDPVRTGTFTQTPDQGPGYLIQGGTEAQGYLIQGTGEGEGYLITGAPSSEKTWTYDYNVGYETASPWYTPEYGYGNPYQTQSDAQIVNPWSYDYNGGYETASPWYTPEYGYGNPYQTADTQSSWTYDYNAGYGNPYQTAETQLVQPTNWTYNDEWGYGNFDQTLPDSSIMGQGTYQEL